MKKGKLPAIVTTLILTAITSLFWIIFNVYRSFSQKPEIDIPSEILEPLNPNLDSKTIEEIKQRNYLDSVPEPVVISSTPEPQVSIEPQASEEATLNENP